MRRRRVVAFIDGFNLYHAIDNLKVPAFKWLDLRKLSGIFVHPYLEELTNVFNFSTIASHRDKASQIRQRTYIRALELKGVKTILGQFKRKDRHCSNCSFRHVGHEEKETDVNIALSLIDFAYQNMYDRALLVTNDSDQAPSIRKVLERFPRKKITVIIPPHTRECNELIKAASNKAKITGNHLERSLLPEVVSDASGLILIRRPKEYEPMGVR